MPQEEKETMQEQNRRQYAKSVSLLENGLHQMIASGGEIKSVSVRVSSHGAKLGKPRLIVERE